MAHVTQREVTKELSSVGPYNEISISFLFAILEPISDGEEEGNGDVGEGSQEISGGQSPAQIDNPYLKHTQKSSWFELYDGDEEL